MTPTQSRFDAFEGVFRKKRDEGAMIPETLALFVGLQAEFFHDRHVPLAALVAGFPPQGRPISGRRGWNQKKQRHLP